MLEEPSDDLCLVDYGPSYHFMQSNILLWLRVRRERKGSRSYSIEGRESCSRSNPDFSKY